MATFVAKFFAGEPYGKQQGLGSIPFDAADDTAARQYVADHLQERLAESVFATLEEPKGDGTYRVVQEYHPARNIP